MYEPSQTHYPGWMHVHLLAAHRDKDVIGELRYVSYMRPTENGSTDYLSVTIIPDATAQVILSSSCLVGRCTSAKLWESAL